MADDIDYANSLVESAIERALSEIRKNTANRASGSDTCAECGDTIPPARKKLGFTLCVPCVEDSERKKHLFAN